MIMRRTIRVLKTKAREVETAANTVGKEFARFGGQAVGAVLHRLGLPSRRDVRILTARVERLSAQVEKLVPLSR